MFLLEGIIACECKILFIPKGMKWQHPSWSGMRIIRLIGPPTVFATSVFWGDGKTKGRTQDIEGQPKESTWKLHLRFPSHFPCSTILGKPKNIQLQKPDQSWAVKDFPNISKMNNTTTSPFGSFLRLCEVGEASEDFHVFPHSYTHLTAVCVLWRNWPVIKVVEICGKTGEQKHLLKTCFQQKELTCIGSTFFFALWLYHMTCLLTVNNSPKTNLHSPLLG